MRKYLIFFLGVAYIYILCIELSIIKKQVETKWNTIECYVQIQGNEAKQRQLENNHDNLKALDLKGGKIKIYFSTVNKEPEIPGVYRVYVIKRIDSGGSHLVKDYEKIEEDELPKTVKDKIKVIN
ncbi:hypothetical protein [Bacillus cereus]|uniref:hypothetical protein n=1 Tax=Bacillus cereus TaxID=1396 RepID=UPI000C28301B|nr:hypothetical protein [Bacillus cereus]